MADAGKQVTSSWGPVLKQALVDAASLAVGVAVSAYAAAWVFKRLSPLEKRKEESDANQRAFLARYREFKGSDEVKLPEFNEYETSLMSSVTFPGQEGVSFEDIGGLLSVKEALYECIVLPLQRPDLFGGGPAAAGGGGGRRKLLTAPRGILFYGPPGTGKTMTAKAIARDSGATFINVDLSTLIDKYVGESEKLVTALFTLAHKLEPSIIFVDEIDGLLRSRGSQGSEHWVLSQVLSLFMSLWDGLGTNSNNRVIVLGATNRPEALDPAVLRRLPRTFLFDLPGYDARAAILRKLLSREEVSAEVSAEVLAELTDGYSGSDLTEMCKVAVLAPIREFVRHEREQKLRDASYKSVGTPRELRMADFQEALRSVPPTGHAAQSYGQRKSQQAAYNSQYHTILNRLEESLRDAAAGGHGGHGGGGGDDDDSGVD